MSSGNTAKRPNLASKENTMADTTTVIRNALNALAAEEPARPLDLRSDVVRDMLAHALATALTARADSVRAIHTPVPILAACGHDHSWAEVEQGTAHCDYDSPVGITCRIVTTVCQECCISEGDQTDKCASVHDWHHGTSGYHCRTVHALDGASDE